jgi:hypothetical protein
VITLLDIVKEQAGLGDRDEASRTAEHLREFATELFAKSETGNAEDVVSADIAGALAAVDDFEGAFGRAATAYHADMVAGEAALAAVNCLDRDKARRYVDEAIARMAAIELTDRKYMGLIKLVEAQARIGDFEGAKRSARSIGEGPSGVEYDMTDGQPYAMLLIANLQRIDGRVEAGRETLREGYRMIVDHPQMRGPEGRLLQIAGGQIAAGDLDGALRSVEAMPEGSRAETLANIARALAIACRPEDARKALDRAVAELRAKVELAPPPDKPEPPLGPNQARPFPPNASSTMKLAEIQATAGETTAALKTLGTLVDDNYRRFTLEKIISARATAGDVKGALDLAIGSARTVDEKRSALQGLGEGVENRLRMESR